MHRFRTAFALGFAVVLALAVASCGNEEDNDYVGEVNSLQEAYVEDVTELTTTPATSANAVAKTATELSELTAGLAADIEAVDPPDDVTDLHQQLVDAMNGVADEIGGLESRLSGADPQQAIQAATDLTAAVTDSQTEIRSLIDQINEQLNE